MNRRDLLRAAAVPILTRAIGAPKALATATGGNRRAALDGFLRQQVERQRVIGITAQVVRRDGEIVYAGTAGQRDPSSNEAIQPDMTLFRLASMTKPITAVAVLMLVEAGRITLEDPVSRFLPDFQSLQVQTQPGHTVPEVRPPTIRDLFRHTSGLSYRFMNVPGIVEGYEWLGVDDGLAAPDLTLAENLRRLAYAPLLLLNRGELDSVRLLREETVAAMSQPQTGGLPIDLAGPGYDFGYGVAVLTGPGSGQDTPAAGRVQLEWRVRDGSVGGPSDRAGLCGHDANGCGGHDHRGRVCPGVL